MRKIAFMLFIATALLAVSCEGKSDETPEKPNQEVPGGEDDENEDKDKFYLTVDKELHKLGVESTAFYIEITSNTEWSIRIDQGQKSNPVIGEDNQNETWITSSQGWGGMGNEKVRFELAEYKNDPRTGYVNISYRLSDGTVKTVKVTIVHSHPTI